MRAQFPKTDFKRFIIYLFNIVFKHCAAPKTIRCRAFSIPIIYRHGRWLVICYFLLCCDFWHAVNKVKEHGQSRFFEMFPVLVFHVKQSTRYWFSHKHVENQPVYVWFCWKLCLKCWKVDINIHVCLYRCSTILLFISDFLRAAAICSGWLNFVAASTGQKCEWA